MFRILFWCGGGGRGMMHNADIFHTQFIESKSHQKLLLCFTQWIESRTQNTADSLYVCLLLPTTITPFSGSIFHCVTMYG